MLNTTLKRGKKITILGAGNVGASIAFALVSAGLGSEIVLVDINVDKATGEAMDIIQGTAFTAPNDIYAGDYSDAVDSDIVIVTLGIPRKPGQTRIDLAKVNVDLIKEVMPKITKYAPNAVYIAVSNPVDIITYTMMKISGLPSNQIFGSGTILDSARLRSIMCEEFNIPASNIHAYVFGEHGDTAVIPWSLARIGGLTVTEYIEKYWNTNPSNAGKSLDLPHIEESVRASGAKVIKNKGATYYAIALSVRKIVDCVLHDTGEILPVSYMMSGEYGISDVCISLPHLIGANGILSPSYPTLTADEQNQLVRSADSLKAAIKTLNI